MSLELREVVLTYAPHTALECRALDGVSLRVEDGEFVGIMGRTGCGKSTLLQVAAGLMRPAEGTVLVDGEDIYAPGYRRSRLCERMGVLFQYPEKQLFETTVEREVSFALRHTDLTMAERRERVCRALELVGFDYQKVREQSPLGFSGGEKRRLAIAGVLAARPGSLLLDEPIAGLDPVGRQEFLALTDRLCGEGVTVLLVSHNADALADHARRIVILENGVLAADGPVEQVFSRREELARWGVSPGQAAECAEQLRTRGEEVPPDVIRYGELLPYLLRMGRRRER